MSKIQILTLTGESAVGKSTLLRKLIGFEKPKFRVVTSTTTRESRKSDLIGEYEYQSQKKFLERALRGEFLWTAKYRDALYGTSRKVIEEVFERGDGIGVMILVPDSVLFLKHYLGMMGLAEKVWSIYLCPPTPYTLRLRMQGRGDSLEAIEKSIVSTSDWHALAQRLDCFDVFVSNPNELDPGTTLSFEIARSLAKINGEIEE